MLSFGFRIATHSWHNQLVHTEKFSYIDQLYGFVFGISRTLDATNSALWFLTCLFCTTILFYWLSKLQKTGFLWSTLAFLGLIGPVIYNYIEWRLPWNVELSFVSVVFYGIGYFALKTVILEIPKNIVDRLLILVTLFIILIISAKINGQVNMAGMQFRCLLFFYIGAFSGISAIILLAKMIPNNACFEWLSRNTIVIFSTHIIIFCVFKGLSKIYLDIDPYADNWDIGLFYTIGALVISYPISLIIDRYFPCMVGYRMLLPRKRHSFNLKVSQPFQ
jgi:acyltransferase